MRGIVRSGMTVVGGHQDGTDIEVCATKISVKH